MTVATGRPLPALLPPGRAERGGRHDRANQAGRDPWYVRYLLQAADDPSLLDPGRRRLEARGAAQTVFSARRVPAPRVPARGPRPGGEPLPADRGEPEGRRARRLRRSTPPAPTSSSPRRPGCWSRPASACCCPPGGRARGPSCGWRPGPTSRVAQDDRAAAGCRSTRSSSSDWEVALGDQTLTLEELRRWPGSRRRWCRCAASGSQLNAEEIQAALDFWKAQGRARPPLRERGADGPGRPRGAGRPRLRGRHGRRAGSPTCSPSSKGTARSTSLPPPDGLPRHAAALPGARLSPGSASSAAGASAPAWPTTWAWARRSRRSPSSSATGEATASRGRPC